MRQCRDSGDPLLRTWRPLKLFPHIPSYLFEVHRQWNKCAIITSYFKQYPEAQNEFKSFKDIPFDELSKNKRFQAHCANLVSTLGKVIEQMHDPELMEASVINFTEKHKNRGQTQKQFENLKQLLLDSFPSLFGKQYTSEVQEAWKKALDLIFSRIYHVYAD